MTRSGATEMATNNSPISAPARPAQAAKNSCADAVVTATSSTADRRPRTRGGAGLVAPVDGPGDERVAAERATQDLLDAARAGEQRRQLDAGVNAHLVQHRDE